MPPAGNENRMESVTAFEGQQVAFNGANTQPVAFVDAERSGTHPAIEILVSNAVLDNESRIEATTFLDTTSGRGVG